VSSARHLRISLRFAASLALLLVPSASGAGELRHRVEPGESASAIAGYYYGDHEKATLLLLYNGRSGTTIRAGETLRVPFSEAHVVRPGESWSELAERCCGRVSAYPSLAVLNAMSPREPLPAGRRVVLPAVFSYRLGRGESLALLAERWYGDAELGRVLQTFNEIEDPRRLSVGQRVEIPIVSLALRESLRVERAEADVSPREEAEVSGPGEVASSTATSRPGDDRGSAGRTALFTSRLREAELDFLEGDYPGARAALESLRGPVLSRGSSAEQAELWRLLGHVYVAYDLPAEACAAERRRRALLPFPDPEVDPDLVSPKIRAVLSGCGPG
jgi:hypothetical protein